MANLVLDTNLEIIETINLNMGDSVLIIGINNEDIIIPHYQIYKPVDRIDCQDKYNDSMISKSYWEAYSQGAPNISCVSLPEITANTIDILFSVLDNYSFDILIIPEVYSDNRIVMDRLAYHQLNQGSYGNGFICVISPGYASMLNNNEYIQYLLYNKHTLPYSPQFFIVPVGTIKYNKYSIFEYDNNAVATLGGLISALPIGVNPSYKSFTGTELLTEFTEEQINILLDNGFAPIVNVISKGVCLYKAVTTEGNTYTHIAHARIANIVNKSLRMVLTKYIGNMLVLSNVYSDIDGVLTYYQNNGHYRHYKYNVTQINRHELYIDLTITPNDTTYVIHTNLNVRLTI